MKRTKRIRRLCCTIPLVLSTASSNFLPVLADEIEEIDEINSEDLVADIDSEQSDEAEKEEHSDDEIQMDEEQTEETIVENVYDVTDSIEDGIYQIQVYSNNNFVLDVDGDKSDDGTNIYIYTNTNSNFTRWKIEHDSEGYVSIINLGSKKALDANGAKSDNGTNIQLWTPNSSSAQKWKILLNGDGTFRIASKMNTSKVLDVDNGDMINKTNVQLWDYISSSKGQKWKFVKWTCPHNYKYLRTDTTEKLDHVRTNVLVQAYDEPVYEKHTYVVCNGCGAKFSTTSEWTAHNKPYALKGDGSHGSYSVKTESIKTGTIHHDAVVEYYNVYIVSYKFWYKCDICDDVILYNTAESTREEKTELKGWIKLDDNYWYYISDDGTFYKGWLHLNNIWYYLDSSGHMVTGWRLIDEKWYYFNESGHMLTGWNEINGYWYYMDEHGVTTYGWRQINEKWYYFDDHAHMVTGWQDINNERYYFDEHGVMQKGWQTLDGEKYYFNEDGKMHKGWKILDGNKYYFNVQGKMLIGWYRIDEKWYHFDNKGIVETGWQTIGSSKYYFDSEGIMQIGLQTIGDSTYYFDEHGVMQTGLQEIEDATYYFDVHGVMQKGWKIIDGKKHYFNVQGKMLIGWYRIDEKWYHFDDDGVVQTGWQTIGSSKYYFDSEGIMQTGEKTIFGIKYYFTEDGKLVEIENITLNVHEISLGVSDTYKLEAEVGPSNLAEAKICQWNSSDSSVAEVDEDGNVYAKALGTATITAETITGLTDSCVVTVEGMHQTLTGYSITAGSEIGLNYHFDMDRLSVEKEPYILFAVNGRTQKSSPSLDDKGEYVFTVTLNYKEMNTPVSAVFVCGSDIKNLDTYSIQDYVETMNEHSDEYETKYIDIANAMLNCGYRIQDYFGYNTESKRIELNVEEVEIPATYEQGNRIESFIGSRLVLKSKMKIKLYFRNINESKIDGTSVDIQKEDMYDVITIEDITPLNIGNTHSIEVDENSMEYGVLDFCYLAQQSGRQELVDMARAIYTLYRTCTD